MPYEPDASGILTEQAATSQGQQAGKSIGEGIDAGIGIQGQLLKAQMMRQQLQEQMDQHRANMVNKMGTGLYELASADDDQKKDPIWKAKKDYYLDGFSKMGVQIDPTAVETLLKDPTHSKKLATALSSLNNSSLDPVQKAQALEAGAPYLGGIESITKVTDSIATAQSKLMQAGNRSSQFIDTQAKSIRDKVQSINSKLDTSQSFANEASSILSKWPEFKTGAAETALKDAYNKALSGGAPRSFTLAMMDQNRSWATKLDGYFSKIESGVKLTDPERKDMSKALEIMKDDTENKRYEQLSPYYHATKGLKSKAEAGSQKFDPSEVIPTDQWNKLVDREEGKTLDPSTGKFNEPEKTKAKPKLNPKTAPQFSNYELGTSKSKDNAIKIGIKQGWSLQKINSFLHKSGNQLSMEDYKSLRGAQ